MYTLELKEVRKKALEERIQIFESIKTTGTQLFKDKNFMGALYFYEKALGIFIWPESEAPNAKVVF
jgi:hypothetical protein